MIPSNIGKQLFREVKQRRVLRNGQSFSGSRSLAVIHTLGLGAVTTTKARSMDIGG
jgi:hypothetical protein